MIRCMAGKKVDLIMLANHRKTFKSFYFSYPALRTAF